MSLRLECLIKLHRVLLVFIVVLFGCLSVNAQCSPEQTAKLLADDGAAGDVFGRYVAISGTTSIVGARNDDDNGENSGSAYLFDTTTGQQIAKLLPEDGEAGEFFGGSVSIGATTAIVGAWRDDDNGDWSGSAYLFDTTTGQQIAKLLPEDGEEGEYFGGSVSIGATTAIVGAWRDDDNGFLSGSAYLFDATTGQQIAKLLPNDGAADDRFGASVAISGSTAIVGSTGDDDNGEDSGSAYLFDTTTGQQIAKLLPNDGAWQDRFGICVEISGNMAIVGASRNDDNGENSGSAYLFDTTTGQQIAKLLPNDGAADDRFGASVAISESTAIVGSTGDDDNGEDSGSVYLFDLNNGRQIGKLIANDGEKGDSFGTEVGISGTTVVVGAPNDNGVDSGSAYLFDVSSCGGTDLINADQYNIFRGLHAGGDLSDTYASDDSYLKFNPGLTINSAEPPVWIEFEGTLPSDSPTSLSVTLEAQAGTTGLTQTIEMFNWNTGQYEQVDAQSASWNEDSIVTVELTFFISDFVQGGTGAVETRVGWNDTGPILNYPWTICIDQVVWTVIQ